MMKKKVIFNPFTPIPKSAKSHVRGWSEMWAARLNAVVADKDTDISDCDVLYLDHGVNFSGSLNLFGGLNQQVYDQLFCMFEALDNGAKLVFLDMSNKVIGYEDLMTKRLGANSTSLNIDKAFIKACGRAFNKAKTKYQTRLKLPNIIIGDSHTTAFAAINDKVVRKNGQTLYNVLYSSSLENYIFWSIGLNSLPSDFKHITLCLGSIDVRFHTYRPGVKPLDQILEEYIDQIKDFTKKHGLTEKTIQVCLPVPIETETRRIPKSGFYKGEPFYGTREQRIEANNLFEHMLNASGISVISPPKHWYKMAPHVYEKQIMEHGGSVHISPLSYRQFSNDWNI